MKLTRFILVINIMLCAYCAVLVAILIPWAGVAIGIGVVIGLCKRDRRYTAFGTARWAGINDLRGMVDGGNGLIVGQVEDTTSLVAATKALFDESVPSNIAVQQFLQSSKKPPIKLLRLNRAVHTAVFAPTGVGKGVSCVIPFLLTNKEACFVLDVKDGELAKITAEARRRRMGRRVYIIDPYHCVTNAPETLNPVQFIDKNSPYALDDSREVSAEIVERKEEKGDCPFPGQRRGCHRQCHIHGSRIWGGGPEIITGCL